jgi:hypothetical protein
VSCVRLRGAPARDAVEPAVDAAAFVAHEKILPEGPSRSARDPGRPQRIGPSSTRGLPVIFARASTGRGDCQSHGAWIQRGGT